MQGKLAASGGTIAPDGAAVELYGLQRRFRGQKGVKEFWAITGSWLELPEKQLFCLLGPNGAGAPASPPVPQTAPPPAHTVSESTPAGNKPSASPAAGKSTTINILTGVLPPSGGDAIVQGESVRSAGGMAEIRAIMGVCPQFDVLWNELTGLEHMIIFGHMKGLQGKGGVRLEAEQLLSEVSSASKC